MFSTEGGSAQGSVLEVAEDVDVKLARLMESQARATTVRSSNYTDEEKRIREAILTQYGQYSDEEGEGNSHPAPGPTAVVKTGLERNTNAALVAQAEREKREQSKIESQRKKDKDKEDRCVRGCIIYYWLHVGNQYYIVCRFGESVGVSF